MADDNKRLPESKADPVYPLNRVFETPGGHAIEFDDTSEEAARLTGDPSLKAKDQRRIRVSHALGSYMEIGESGDWTTHAQGSTHSYSKGGGTATYEKAMDVRSSHTRRLIGSDRHNETAGDTYHAGTGNHTQGGKNHTTSVRGDITLTSSGGDIVISNKDKGGATITSREINISAVSGGLTMSVKGEFYTHVQGSGSLVVDGDYKIKAKRMILEAPGGIGTKGPSIKVDDFVK